LISRGFTEKSFWTQHFLGSAEDQWDGLTRFLQERKVPMELAVELGLIRPRTAARSGTEGHYDFFRRRLILPIRNQRGEVIGFGGRAIPGGGASDEATAAKYLNSADSVIYQKGRTVYGLSAALPAIRSEDRVVIVEGFLDVLACYQGGVAPVVAPLGTALTPGHLQLLKRFTRNMWLVFDGDAAGRMAARRSLPLFLAEGIVARVVMLPHSEDPDSFIRAHGGAAFLELLPTAPTLFESVIDTTVAECGADTAGKARAVDQLRPLFNHLTDHVEEAMYCRRLAQRIALEESVVRRALKQRGRAVGIRPTAEESAARSERPMLDVPRTAEWSLIEFLLQVPSAMALVSNQLHPEEFTHQDARAIAEACWCCYEADGDLSVAALIESPGIVDDKTAIDRITALALAEGKYEDQEAWPRVAEELVAAVRRPRKVGRLRELNAAIASAEQGGQAEAVRHLILEKQQLLLTQSQTGK
ncbi:MAG: toprim domain-containing protein, partial [Deltaproteobacteria bacterium]|nr:toprim domain-containing protein [Deltaproteobacteria bacterium]